MKRADKRRMNELRVEVGVRDSFKKKLVRSRLRWAGHVERLGDEKLAIKNQKVEVICINVDMYKQVDLVYRF